MRMIHLALSLIIFIFCWQKLHYLRELVHVCLNAIWSFYLYAIIASVIQGKIPDVYDVAPSFTWVSQRVITPTHLLWCYYCLPCYHSHCHEKLWESQAVQHLLINGFLIFYDYFLYTCPYTFQSTIFLSII
jgi:hypothetical protein